MKSGFARLIPLILIYLAGVLRADDLGDLVNMVSMKRPPLEEIRYATSCSFTGERLHPFFRGLCTEGVDPLSFKGW